MDSRSRKSKITEHENQLYSEKKIVEHVYYWVVAVHLAAIYDTGNVSRYDSDLI